MVIDFRTAFGEDFIDRLKTQLKGRCANELMVLSSSSSTQEDQEAYGTLSHYINVDASYTMTGISADVGLDEEKMPSKFREKFSSMIDLVNMNFNKIGSYFIEAIVQAETELSSFVDRVSEILMPQIEQEVSAALGGVS